MSDKSMTRIAIAGHANTGKTTLIRTLLKSPVGKIEDKAGATTFASDYKSEKKLGEHLGLQAIFIDTPGFTRADTFRLLIEMKQKDPSFEVSSDFHADKFTLNERAYNAIKSADAVIYVASLEGVPDEQHEAEIKLIKSANPRIVGLLNKGKSQANAHRDGVVGIDKRITQWIKLFNGLGIDKSVVFDAHWDKPKKIISIYKNIESVLDSEKVEEFRSGIARFEERQKKVRSLACQKIAQCVRNCYETRESETNESTHLADHSGSSEKKAKTAAINESKKKITAIIGTFYHDIADIFTIAAQSPTLSADDIETKHYKVTDGVKVLKSAATGATVGGAGAAGVGAGIGALVGGLITVGLGAAAGALIGAKIGGIIGAAIGATGGAVMEVGDIHKAVLTDATLYQIENACISSVWALSHHGYGCGAEISTQSITELDEQVMNFNKKHFEIEEFAELVRKYERILDEVDNM